MFSRKSIGCFIVSAVMIIIAYVCMVVDPEPSGFGVLTLWIAPPILLSGFMLPIAGIIGIENIPKLSNAPKLFTWKRAFGIIAFCIAFSTYIITLEPTASLWDCSEFIASSYKLQVPHTPGTPLTLLFGRIFSMFASDEHNVAWMINMMSAFFSALSVVLLYYIIYYFGERLIALNDRLRKSLLIIGSLSGSLCLAFSDTFWFSAVEAETYGVACFFLLLLVWMMLKGSDSEEPLRSKMFVLIGYMSGLAYCIHPMCLLILPVLPFVWFTKHNAVTFKTTLITVISGSALVFVINRFIAIGIFDLGFTFDLIAVNTFGLPFYSGLIILLLLITTSFYFMVRKFKSYGTYIWAVIFLCLGFVPYAMLFIRSNQNPPIDETNPEDLYMIKAYMNRESYGSTPLLFGPYFDARIESVTTKNKSYYKDSTDYKIAGTRVEYEFEKSRETILPRIYSRDANHIQAYRQWLGLETNQKPTFADNLKFMFTYQLGHMYLRYLLWNFAGRESDVQNSASLKPWDRLSNGISERSRNQYWMLPLLLGIVGACVQFRRDKKGFISTAIFFLFTGLVLAVYLNSPPIEPRERDYIYVASYIAFCIWIGLGIISIRAGFIRNAKHSFVFIIGVSTALPLWMLYQNFDDHDRSGRTFQIDYARTVLDNCAPNSVLFTGGDNDTFPLWYLQEVEDYRTDVRVIVLSYFNTDWYINQLRRPYYLSQPLQLTLDEKDYRQYGLNDVLYLDDKIKQGIDVVQYLTLIKQEHPALHMTASDGDAYHILPSRILKIKSKREISDELLISVTGNYLEKNALAILDLIASNEWKRPLYFNFTSMNSIGIDLKPYLIQEGLVFRLTSERTEKGPAINTEFTYKNLIESAGFTNLADANVNFNYEDFHARMIVPLRQSFNALAEAYLEEGNNVMAEKVLMASVEKLHYPHLRPSYTDLFTADMLMNIGKKDLAKALTVPAFNYYYDEVKSQMQQKHSPDNFDVYMLRQSTSLLNNFGETSYVRKFDKLGL
jgi:hypothetical protein